MVEIRVTRPGERRRVANLVSRSLLHAPPDDETFERSLPSWEDFDSLSAWEGNQPIGHVGGYRLHTVVPGGARLATSAVARVGVAATARRRGVASTLMTRLLHDAAERGQVLSSLRASEAVIYGRFGYGIAGNAAELTFTPGNAGPISGIAPGSMRLLEPDEILAVVAPIYDRVIERAGMLVRPDWMWQRYYENALKLGGDAEYVAVHANPDGVDDGFVHYGTKWHDDDPFTHGGKGEVQDLIGASPGVELALWSFLADIDLVRTWRAEERPVDDVLRLAVRNQRSVAVPTGGWDEQWLRLVDVGAALTARRYGDASGAVTIAVDDDVLSMNSGVWMVDAGGAQRLGGANPESADLVTDVATLAATYMGGFRWSALAAAGRVQVNDAAAVPRADALFLAAQAPFCGSFF